MLLYEPRTAKLVKTFTRFKETAYSGSLRSDGGALAAGGESGIVQLFDSHSRACLRQFRGHARAVHAVRCGADRRCVLSGGDDATVRLWDVASGAQTARCDGHTDYVRCAAEAPRGAALWATGSYDHSVRLWDVRAPNAAQCAFVLPHGAQVEDLAFFPAGGLLASAGGDSLCVWDLAAGGKLLRRLRAHAKALTCVRVYDDAGPPPPLPAGDIEADDEDDAADAAFAAAGARGGGHRAGTPRMLAGSLDGVVKVYELDTFRVTHSARYAGPVLSLALTPDCGALAVGCANGLLALRRRSARTARAPVAAAGGRAASGSGGRGGVAVSRRGRAPDAGSYRFFVRGQSARAAAGDAVAAARRRAALAPYDAALRRFRGRAALDAALATRAPAVVAAVLDALAQRGGLAAALAGRDAPALTPLLHFLARHIAHPRHCRMLTAVAAQVLDIYAPAVGADAAVDAALRALAQRVTEEVQAQQALAALAGALEPLLAASMRGLAL